MDTKAFSDRSTMARNIPTRRAFLGTVLLGSAVALAACASPAPSPTSAPPQPASKAASAPTAAAQPTAAAKPAAQPAATQSAAPTAAPKTVAQKPLEKNTFKIGMVANLYENVYASIGLAQGIYKEFGFENGEFVDFARPGTEQVRSLLSGEMDLVEIGFATMTQPVQEGAAMKFVGCPRVKNNYMFMTKKEIETPADLAGKTVGIGPANAQLHTITLGLFDVLGVDPSQVNFVTIGSSTDVAKAVFAGTVDAGLVTSDLQVQARNYPDIKVMSDLAQSMPNWLRVLLVATNETIEQRPEFLTRLLAAYSKSMRYALEHREETVKHAVALYGLDQTVAEQSFDIYLRDRLMHVNMDFSSQQVEFMQDLLVRLGIQKVKLPEDQIVDLRPLNEALSRIGRFEYS